MNSKRGVLFATGALLVLIISGCGSYGELSLIKPGPQEKVTISTLVDHWQDYDVYVGTYDSALMFAFKTRERHIAPASYWDRVEDKEDLDKIVNDIASQPDVGIYWPRLWKILGPEGHLYGYMFTAWDHVDMSKVDKNTLYVYDVPPPPYMEVGPGMIGNEKQ